MMEKLLIILMIAITCAYVGYKIAGRAAGVWVGLMLGPPGLVVLHCVKQMIQQAISDQGAGGMVTRRTERKGD